MARCRFQVMLPCQFGPQKVAACAVLNALRTRFPGGTWIALEGFEPVTFGWWRPRLDSAAEAAGAQEPPPPVLDDHILVWLDYESTRDTLSVDEVADLIGAIFRWHYKKQDPGEEVISITCQQVALLDRPGMWEQAAR